MKIIDAFILARTKRKTRKLRTALVTLVSSLLFAVLFFGAILVDGLQTSAAKFENVGFNNRFLTTTQIVPGSNDFITAQEAIERQMQTELTARKIKVDDKLKQNPEYQTELQTRLAKHMAEQAKAKIVKYEEEIKRDFAPKALYHLNALTGLTNAEAQKADSPDPYLQQIQKQVDTGAAEGDMAKPVPLPMPDEGNISQPEQRAEFLSVEPGMVQSHIVSGQNTDWEAGKPYPVVVPYDYVASLADRSFAKVTSAEKIQGYRDLIREYSGKEITFCYRNTEAQNQLHEVLLYNKNAKQDDNKDTNPLQVAACTAFDQAQLKKVGIIKDQPEPAEKPLFPKPAAIAPATKIVKFKIVGFIPTFNFNSLGGDILGTVFMSVNLWPAQTPLLIPDTVITADPFLAAMQKEGGRESFGVASIFAEFANRQDQKRYLASGCQGFDCTGEKPMVTPFGSVKVATEDIVGAATVGIGWAVLVIGAIAALMIMFTLSKVLADSAKEIAVFRALGARRLDIAQIYVTYGLMLACSALGMALLFGASAAYVLAINYSSRVHDLLVEAVGAYDSQTTTSIFSIQPVWISAIAMALLGAALLGMSIPILASIRRNPMKQMREE